MQALFRDCSVAAVLQGAPLSPREFVRAARRLSGVSDPDRNATAGCAAVAPPPTAEQAAAAVDATAAAAAGDLSEALVATGATRAPVAALAGRPLRYTACAGTTWEAPGNALFDISEVNGPAGTFLPLLNACPRLPARVNVTVTATGAHPLYLTMHCPGNDQIFWGFRVPAAAGARQRHGHCHWCAPSVFDHALPRK